MPESSRIKLMTFVIAVFGFMVGPFSTCGEQMYTIKLNNCDKHFYENTTKWYTGAWSIVAGLGVCPNGRTKFKIQNGRNGNVRTKIYRDCIHFTKDNNQWSVIDDKNHELGFKTNLSHGAEIWSLGSKFYITGVIFAYIYFGLAGAGLKDNDENCVGLCLLMIPFSFLFFIIFFSLIMKTDQLNPNAWSTYYFQTCDVTIKADYHLYGLLTATIMAGFVSLIIILLFSEDMSWKFRSCCESHARQNRSLSSSSLYDDDIEVTPTEAEVATVNIPLSHVQIIRQTIKDTRNRFVRQLSSNSIRLRSSSNTSHDDNISHESLVADEVKNDRTENSVVVQPIIYTESFPIMSSRVGYH